MRWSHLFWRVSKWSFVYFVTVVFFLILTIVFVPHFSQNHETCYWTDRLLPYIDCRSVPYREIVKFILNFPLYALFLPLFAIPALFKGPFWMFGLGVFDGIVILIGIVYPFLLLDRKWSKEFSE